MRLLASAPPNSTRLQTGNDRSVKGDLYLLVALFACLAFAYPHVGQAQSERRVFHLQYSGPVTPAMLTYLERGLREAEAANAEAVVFSIDTPGGSVDITKRVAQIIQQSTVPVIVYVSPARAWAASAGTLITLSGHLAAMAPETLIGAASPVGGAGEELPDTAKEKAIEAVSAAARSLAAHRGAEAVAWADATVRSAQASTPEEALAAGAIDVIASDVADLLRQMDGRQVTVGGQMRTLHLQNVETVEFETQWFEDLLALLSSPVVATLLLTIGLNAILYELSAPGGYVAGAIGVICLLLAFYSLGTLEAKWAGLAFIAIAFILFVVEIKANTGGALTVAGILSFVLGTVLLFDSPFVQVPWATILGLATAMAVFAAFSLRMVARAQRSPVTVGADALIGLQGEARTALDPSGTVFVNGAWWTAESEDDSVIAQDSLVQVTRRDGNRLWVRRVGAHQLADSPK